MEFQQKNLPTTKDSQPKQQKSAAGSKFWPQFKENAQVIILALILAFLIRTFVAEPRYIPSDSMLPTLEQGDRLVVEKISRYFHPPVKGNIVVFQPPLQLQIQGYGKDQVFIKRAIGEPGQTVAVRNGIVFVDDRPLKEEYIAEAPRYELNSVRVPEGQLFVMGDNRNNSNDSHIWGFLPEKNVIGRAVFRFWPIDRIGRL